MSETSAHKIDTVKQVIIDPDNYTEFLMKKYDDETASRLRFFFELAKHQTNYPTNELDQSGSVSISAFQDMVEVYYYQLKNSLIYIFKEEADNESRKSFELNSGQRVLVPSIDMACKAFYNSDKFIPEWINIVRWEIQKNLSEEFSKYLFLKTELTASQEKPIFIKASARPHFKITMPALIRPFLTNYANLIFSAFENELTPEHIFFMFFPFMLYYNDPYRISLNSLPRAINFETDVFTHSKAVGHYQTIFLVLHELGHIRLGHLTSDEIKCNYPHPHLQALFDEKTHDYNLYKEFEADTFAFHVMDEWPEEEMNLIHYSLASLFRFFDCLDKTQNRVSAILNPKFKYKDKKFNQRFIELSKRPSQKKSKDEYYTNLNIANHWVIDQYLKILNYISDKELENVINHYTQRKGFIKTDNK